MKPVDARLRYAASARLFFGLGGVLAALQTACIVGFAWLVSSTVVAAIGGASLSMLVPSLAALVGVIVLRSAIVWLMEVNAARGSAIVKSELRRKVLASVARLGPGWLAGRSSVRVSTMVTTGLDALDTYFAKYLPQLILTAIATPVLVVVMLVADLTSGVIVVLTLPLIPVFMVLIGWATQALQAAQWEKLGALSSGFLDVVEGLSTLKVFGREKRQVGRIRAVTDQYRVSTMKVLRLSFLSGFALELAASLSVALVAVSIGLRLVGGDLGLGVGLFVLMLAPEAFLPLRQVGAAFHAAADGVAATDAVFEVLSADPAAADPAPAAARVASALGERTHGAAITRLWVSHGPLDDARFAVQDFSAELRPGTLTVLAGPSGAGKSSIVGAMLGFVPFSGTIDAAPIAWAGQRPSLLAGTVFDNLTLGSEDPSRALVERALALAAADDIDSAIVLGVNGAGLSVGQAQRVAVARAVYRLLERDCGVLLLDEPSSALDAATEARLIAGVRALAAGGVAVLVVSHRDAFRLAADQLLELAAPALAAEPSSATAALSAIRSTGAVR
ncbi:thiol reductant ABC exporter subunit CydD [Subtercola boreus]|uniref:Thiol reductant ABC exporter subunit CydD n=1 Tax=Subtercola boreus TaxID=120213 RepID=A0A3E0WDN5_9MICO|nr:thiol reductant ABC exporter subunit CydD [Subtercola boreus]RFA21801.1 thiol reductant ABC exporter subunit CydD [Subtercola boreus]RFA21912.1 thiol reductant ABC exporter subunit CydD [Subtercola boreus]RFA27860.1 thiol reductant ABC exporter subunit CydD [Subtercola boreus]